MEYNAYINLYTNYEQSVNNEGKSWVFLTVEGKDNLYVYMGDCVVRGRIAAVQNLFDDCFLDFKDKHLLIVPITEDRHNPYRKDNCWRSLVKLEEANYRLLTSGDDSAIPKAKEIIAYLRRTVDGMDNDNKIYKVSDDFKLDFDQEIWI